MIWVGITGGIASGKTTASEYLSKKGYPVVNADILAHKVVQKDSPGLTKLIKEFGAQYLTQNGELDRTKMGKLVFNDESARIRLEKIIHPLIQAKVQELKKQFELSGEEIAFYDVPLLFEKNLQKNFDYIMLISCNLKHQRQRLKNRNRLSKNEIESRLNSQLPMNEKLKNSDFVIDNDKSLNDLYSAIDFTVMNIIQKATSKSKLKPRPRAE
jgi:dephospho-CoA kinase